GLRGVQENFGQSPVIKPAGAGAISMILKFKDKGDARPAVWEPLALVFWRGIRILHGLQQSIGPAAFVCSAGLFFWGLGGLLGGAAERLRPGKGWLELIEWALAEPRR